MKSIPGREEDVGQALDVGPRHVGAHLRDPHLEQQGVNLVNNYWYLLKMNTLKFILVL
jgi:hypothetical protein